MKRIYFFEEGNKDMKDILGGKGANLAEMSRIGLPVPEGFTIITKVCLDYLKEGGWPEGLKEEVKRSMREMERRTGKEFGGKDNPLLVSVRSGAPISMPGMMDTILNLGLNDESVEGLANLTKNPRFAYDSYRRFIQMFANVVMEIPHESFEELLSSYKKNKGVRYDYELDVETLKKLIQDYKELYKKETGQEFPQDAWTQLEMAIEAVWKSWNNPRAKVYRKANEIPDDLGTAVNIVQMVFGNMGEDSGTGVAFTRNPATGENKLYGEFLVNAQGEDVVAGIRTPQSIDKLKEVMPDVAKELQNVADLLERHYRDMQDMEFTVEKGKLYMLQTRTGKRTAKAAVKIAVDMVDEGLITKEEAVMRVDPNSINQLLHPTIDYSKELKVIAEGLPASPGAASGKIVFDANEAKTSADSGEKVLLVRPETTPDDLHGIIASKGVLTSRGGMTSHAAVVCRGMGKPAVVGCEALHIDLDREVVKVGDNVLRKGDVITIDGSTGKVILGEVSVKEPELAGEFEKLLEWADEYRKIAIKTNADLPGDAKIARRFGAEGIGLCRTEHMFLGPERLPIVQRMILATDEDEKKRALQDLLKRQRTDFIELLEVMDGLPVTIRLLDPPLHEFLPSQIELEIRLAEMKIKGAPEEEIKKTETVLEKVRELHEANPMLGHRGCRLGVTMPELYKMQARAIMEAVCELKKAGKDPRPEIEIPLVSFLAELKFLKKEILDEVKKVLEENNVEFDVKVGTMIELPRAALMAHELAQEADFFSFGTNDLTQTTLGFSRDDAGKFIKQYLDMGILEKDPFQVLDQRGVGRLMALALKEGKSVNPRLEVGICGEHGGEPKSIEFCHRIGLDYVSCSPYRVPVARLAAAHAAIKQLRGQLEPVVNPLRI